jgi:hypothetical protein
VVRENFGEVTMKVIKSVADKQKHSLMTVKVSKAEFERIKAKAKRYAAGNLSEWVRYAAIELEPKPDDLVDV